MKRILLTILAAASILTACDRSNTEIPDVPSTGNVLVLNNGNWGGNDASITLYDIQTGTITANAFQKANGQNLGDLGQDILVAENELYIAVNGSQVVFVTDYDLKIKKTITAEADGNRLSPRYLAIGNGKIYVTYYEGYLAEIDPSKDYAVKTVKVGANPEGLAYIDGKIYVANSGGMNYPNYDNTVSVVSASDFTVSATIEVNTNPAKVLSAGGEIYVTSFGNYADVPAKIQKIAPSTGAVTDLPYENVSSAAVGADEKLYVLCGGYDEQWNPLPGKVFVHGATPTAFVTDQTTFPNAYSISATSDGYVFVGCSDYTTTGDVYMMTSEGTLHAKFDSQGLNPIAVMGY